MQVGYNPKTALNEVVLHVCGAKLHACAIHAVESLGTELIAILKMFLMI